MRRREPLDPVAARELAAVDAALSGRSGEPGASVAPEDAELAQLATLLVAERPPASRAFRDALDARVEKRFAEARPPRKAAAVRAPATRRRPLIPAFAAFAVVAVIALVIAVQPNGGGGGGDLATSSDLAAPSAPTTELAPDAAEREQAPSAADSALGSAAAPSGAAKSDPVSPPPVDAHAAPGARKVEQSSTIELGTPADTVDDVAQDVLGVVTRQQGIVDQSSVATQSGGGEARFQLRIPAARLPAALAQLSRLDDAHVLSRTDDTLDVNQAYVSVARKLDAAEAERSGLLRSLRAADSEAETDRLKLRLGATEARIAELQRSQRALDRRVDYSRVDLTVRADDSAADDGGGAGFTPGSALDDAIGVLSVTAGVVVIAAAALVPLALLALLLWPLARSAQRRRRESALDGG